MYWNPEVLTRIDAADDLKIAPYHPDMNTTGTPTWIWEVKVDNRLFVRAYSGIRSKLRNSLTSLQVNIVNDFTVAKWRKVILFCHLRHNPSVLL